MHAYIACMHAAVSCDCPVGYVLTHSVHLGPVAHRQIFNTRSQCHSPDVDSDIGTYKEAHATDRIIGQCSSAHSYQRTRHPVHETVGHLAVYRQEDSGFFHVDDTSVDIHACTASDEKSVAETVAV